MDIAELRGWLQRYGDAWEAKNTEEFVNLFSPDLRYHWTPFEEPKRGREELARAFEAAIARQQQIKFNSEVLAVSDGKGIVHWQCSFDRVGTDRRVRLDGIFLMEFDADGTCFTFREWWHSDENL